MFISIHRSLIKRIYLPISGSTNMMQPKLDSGGFNNQQFMVKNFITEYCTEVLYWPANMIYISIVNFRRKTI